MNATTAIILGLGVTAALFLLCKIGFGGKKIPFTNFLIGDDNTYSVSRLQAVLWSFVITGFQVSTFIVTARRQDVPFVIVFPPEVLMLFTLSLGSYVVVKGISVNKMIDRQKIVRKTNPQWVDIIAGDNGLDFSRFQMIIWTLFAIVVYVRSCYGYLDAMCEALDTNVDIGVFVKRFFDLSIPNTPIPNIDTTFLVLMGISQGVYVGKKLVPVEKLNDVISKEVESLESQRTDLQKQLAAYDTTLKAADIATAEHAQLKHDTEAKRAATSANLKQIEDKIASLRSMQTDQ